MEEKRDWKQEAIFWALILGILVGAYWLAWDGWLKHLKVNRDLSEQVKVWILAFVMLLVPARWAWHRWMEPRGGHLAAQTRRILAVVLLAVCFVSVVNYGRYGRKLLLERVDAYDLIHYYLGSKYFTELGYYDLYPACILADEENGGPYFRPPPETYQYEGPDGYALKPYGDALVKGAEVKARFSPERWESFSKDFITLQREYVGLTLEYWWQMVNDHGFNGTPAWVAYAAPLAKAVPVEHVKWLCYIDLGLVVLSLGAAWWAFGGWSAGFLLIFFTTGYATRWPTISWAFLRYDFAAALVLATALLRKGYPLLAGVFSGHAAAMRIFPLLWGWGPGVQGLWRLVKERRIDRAWFLFFVGFVGWIAVTQLAVVAQWGVDPIVVHWEGMTDHVQPENLSSRREGLSIALSYHGEVNAPWSPERIQAVDRVEPVARVVGILLVLALGWGLRRSDRAEAFAMGLIPFFCLTTASYYYLVVRAPLVMLHAGDSRKGRHAVGLGLLLLMELFSNFAQQYLGGNRIFLIGWLGWLLLAYSLFTIVVLVWEDRKLSRPAAPAPASLPPLPPPAPETP